MFLTPLRWGGSIWVKLLRAVGGRKGRANRGPACEISRRNRRNPGVLLVVDRSYSGRSVRLEKLGSAGLPKGSRAARSANEEGYGLEVARAPLRRRLVAGRFTLALRRKPV